MDDLPPIRIAGVALAGIEREKLHLFLCLIEKYFLAIIKMIFLHKTRINLASKEPLKQSQ
jgi:hypothetical protein